MLRCIAPHQLIIHKPHIIHIGIGKMGKRIITLSCDDEMKATKLYSVLLDDDLSEEIAKGSKISIAAACFSIYAFQELKKQLKNVQELRFIFTSPTFVKEEAKGEKREFYIPRQIRERSRYGAEFEVKLRNEMTQEAIAKECAAWIKQKAVFKSNITNDNMRGFMNVDDKSCMPLNGFTTVGLGCEKGNNAYYIVQKTEVPMSQACEMILVEKTYKRR